MDKQKSILKVMMIVTYIVGIALIIGGSVGLFYADKISKEYKPTTAKIENIRKYYQWSRQKKRKVPVYEVIVNYRVDNESYQTVLGAYHSSMKIGDHLTVYYNPQ